MAEPDGLRPSSLHQMVARFACVDIAFLDMAIGPARGSFLSFKKSF